MNEYRPARPEDLAAIIALSFELIDRYEDPAEVDIARAKAWTRKKVEQNLSDYRAVFRDGVKAGYFCLHEAGEELEIDDLYLLPHFRGQGIGTEILSGCIAQAEKAGKGLFLYVFRQNFGARALYGRMGFREREQVGKTRLIMAHPGGKGGVFKDSS